MIAIIDYRAGNLRSVARALAYLGYDAEITDEKDTLGKADRVIFPGVGASGSAMRHLRQTGMDSLIHEVVAEGKPFLGICLGFQVLFEHSEEDNVASLGILPGNVVRFPQTIENPDASQFLKIPQMGWNSVDFLRHHPVLAGIPQGSEFYFVHSYFVQTNGGHVLTQTNYGIPFVSGAAFNNLIAFQFHPEKSGRVGLRLLKNFCRWFPNNR